MLIRFWNDSVWSKVIASCIVALGAWAIAKSDQAGTYMKAVTTPNWVVWLIVFAAIIVVSVLIYIARSRKPEASSENITSEEWFSVIDEKLQNCGYARIYLRNFNHPDDFRGEHRESLLKIIKTIKQKIKSNEEIQILSYKPIGARAGDDWLESELGGREKISGHVKIRNTQPMTNSSSMYLFDDRFVVFNKVNGGVTTYHIEQHANSILFELIKRGFEQVWRES